MKIAKMFIVIIYFWSSATAQVPQGIPYQAIARNGQGQPLSNMNVKVRFSILDSTATGTAVYVESHSTTTSALGLFTANVGMGTASTGTFSSINWGQNYKFLKVELDTTATGNSYIDLGTQQMMSVPYALYAGNAVSNSNTMSSMFNGLTTQQYIPSYLSDYGSGIDGDLIVSGNYVLSSSFSQFKNLKILTNGTLNLGSNLQSDTKRTYTILVKDTLYIAGIILGKNNRNYGLNQLNIPVGGFRENTVGATGGAAGDDNGNKAIKSCQNRLEWNSYNNGLNINPPAFSAYIESGGFVLNNNNGCPTISQLKGYSSDVSLLKEALKIRSDLFGSDGVSTVQGSSINSALNGGEGGDGLYIMCNNLVFENSGQVNLSGNNGVSYSLAGYPTMFGGGGGGGSLILSANNIIKSNGSILLAGGNGGLSSNVIYCNAGSGGNGSYIIIC